MTKPLRCAFCDKDQDHLAMMVAGIKACICEECIEICVGLITMGRADALRRKSGEAEYASWFVEAVP